jgi:hypothetical protein
LKISGGIGFHQPGIIASTAMIIVYIDAVIGSVGADNKSAIGGLLHALAKR